MRGLPWVWGDVGDTPPLPTPAGYDGLSAVRAIRVAAPPPVVFRWLTQLAVAPYSYDLLDNRGRRSPRHLVEGIELTPGRTMMEIFRLTAIEPDRMLELVMADPGAVCAFGEIVVAYRTLPQGEGTVLRCDLFMRPHRGPALVRDHLLAWGDVVMMRKQLLTLKALSESSVGGFPTRPPAA
ncbi:hypothetical protein GCM10023339_09710 [Alloalcanivorax gelatiniphagus]